MIFSLLDQLRSGCTFQLFRHEQEWLKFRRVILQDPSVRAPVFYRAVLRAVPCTCVQDLAWHATVARDAREQNLACCRAAAAAAR
jgi:hypothetical protein